MGRSNGFVKLYRNFLEWEWYCDTPVKVLFIHLLLKANYKDFDWQGESFKAGQCVTSIQSLSFSTGLSVQQIRTALSKLQKSSDITRRVTGRYSVITINNWDKYQIPFADATDFKPQGNSAPTTDKEYKNKRSFYKKGTTRKYDYAGYDLELFEQMLNSED